MGGPSVSQNGRRGVGVGGASVLGVALCRKATSRATIAMEPLRPVPGPVDGPWHWHQRVVEGARVLGAMATASIERVPLSPPHPCAGRYVGTSLRHPILKMTR